MNPYQALGLPVRYHLDGAELRRRFLELSRATHPDRHTGQSTQDEALARNAALNDAYKRLQKPGSRLQAILQLHGYLDAEGSNQTGRELDPMFLMDMMDLNEAVDTAQQAPEQQPAVAQQVQQQHGPRQHQLDEHMAAYDAAETDDQRTQALDAAFPLYLELKYLQRLQDRLANLG